MVNISPFRGVRYNKDKVKDLNLVVTAPYDNINEKLQAEYYNRSEYNFVRLNRSREEEKYQSANRFFQQWMKENVMIRDEKPSIYYYTQEYQVEGETRIRKGYIALLELDEFANGNVLPHEHTLSGPKKDRLDLLMATEATFGQIFMLYSDPQDRITQILKQNETSEPTILVNDEYKNIHRVWKIESADTIKQVCDIMKEKTLYIADGHHRYETSVNYRNMQREKLGNYTGKELFNYIMCTYINMDDSKGLSILPTHRAIKNLQDFNLETFLKDLESEFTISKKANLEELSNDLEQNKDKNALGLISEKGNSFHLLVLDDISKVAHRYPKDLADSVRKLDVKVLHTVILEDRLGIDEEKLRQQTHVNYFRHKDELFHLVQDGTYQIAFLLNGTKIEEVKKVTEEGEKMPQKSTDFYPKLLSGLVVNYLKD